MNNINSTLTILNTKKEIHLNLSDSEFLEIQSVKIMGVYDDHEIQTAIDNFLNQINYTSLFTIYYKNINLLDANNLKIRLNLKKQWLIDNQFDIDDNDPQYELIFDLFARKILSFSIQEDINYNSAHFPYQNYNQWNLYNNYDYSMHNNTFLYDKLVIIHNSNQMSINSSYGTFGKHEILRRKHNSESGIGVPDFKTAGIWSEFLHSGIKPVKKIIGYNKKRYSSIFGSTTCYDVISDLQLYYNYSLIQKTVYLNSWTYVNGMYMYRPIPQLIPIDIVWKKYYKDHPEVLYSSNGIMTFTPTDYAEFMNKVPFDVYEFNFPTETFLQSYATTNGYEIVSTGIKRKLTKTPGTTGKHLLQINHTIPPGFVGHTQVDDIYFDFDIWINQFILFKKSDIKHSFFTKYKKYKRY